MPSVKDGYTPEQIKKWKHNETDKRKRKERALISRNVIRKEKGYVLNRIKDPTEYAGKWNCVCKYGIPGHEISIRIPHPLCQAHSKPSRSMRTDND